MTEARQRLGAHGEHLAALAYVDLGAVVVARNWRCDEGELDLVLRHGDELVFAEVKTRRSDAFGHPAEAVGRDKRLRIQRLAQRFMAETGTRAPALRFDVVAVLRGQVEIIDHAF